MQKRFAPKVGDLEPGPALAYGNKHLLDFFPHVPCLPLPWIPPPRQQNSRCTPLPASRRTRWRPSCRRRAPRSASVCESSRYTIFSSAQSDRSNWCIIFFCHCFFFVPGHQKKIVARAEMFLFSRIFGALLHAGAPPWSCLSLAVDIAAQPPGSPTSVPVSVSGQPLKLSNSLSLLPLPDCC